MQSPEDHQRSRPRDLAARRTRLLGFERLESRDMLAAAADAADAAVYADVPSDFVWDYEQWFAAFAGAQDTSPAEPAIVSDDLFIADDQTFVWDDSFVWNDADAWTEATGEDFPVSEDPVVDEDSAVIEDPATPDECVVETSSVSEDASSLPDDATDDAPLPVPTAEPAVDEGDPILVVCPGVVLPPQEVPNQDGSDAKADPLLDEYSRFLALNATWFDDHGGNALQPQVITPSRYLPWIELPTPGAANAFDAWYSLSYAEIPPADGSDLMSETDPGDASEPREIDDAMPPTWVNDSGDGAVVGPVYSVTRSDFGGIPSQPPAASSTAGAQQASSRNWFAWMPFLGMGGVGGDTNESSKPAKNKRFAR